jgi:hypothetical protein
MKTVVSNIALLDYDMDLKIFGQDQRAISTIFLNQVTYWKWQAPIAENIRLFND